MELRFSFQESTEPGPAVRYPHSTGCIQTPLAAVTTPAAAFSCERLSFAGEADSDSVSDSCKFFFDPRCFFSKVEPEQCLLTEASLTRCDLRRSPMPGSAFASLAVWLASPKGRGY